MVMAEYPPLMDDIVKAGARAVVVSLRKPTRVSTPIDFDAERERKRRIDDTVADAARTIVERVEVGSAVIELLDKMEIAGKLLGDCTCRDLITEADAEGRRAEKLAENAEWLRRLASALGPNDTVRTADRGIVAALLRKRFGE